MKTYSQYPSFLQSKWIMTHMICCAIKILNFKCSPLLIVLQTIWKLGYEACITQFRFKAKLANLYFGYGINLMWYGNIHSQCTFTLVWLTSSPFVFKLNVVQKMPTLEIQWCFITSTNSKYFKELEWCQSASDLQLQYWICSLLLNFSILQHYYVIINMCCWS